VLRLAVGCAAVVAGAVCLWADAGSLAVRVATGVLLAASGASLLAGFLTPCAAVLIGSCASALGLSLLSVPPEPNEAAELNVTPPELMVVGPV
jgi:hypothetical protein